MHRVEDSAVQASQRGHDHEAHGTRSDPVGTARYYLQLFPQSDVATIAWVVETIRAERVALLDRWHARYAARFGADLVLSDALFQETYVPYLREAIVRIAGGDAEGFVGFAALLGAQLARSGVPFAVMVAHLQLLKESCLDLLGQRSGVIDQSIVLTIDKLMTCCITAAADSYYRSAPAAPHPDPLPETEVRPLPGTFHGMVGHSPAMGAIFEQISRLAPYSTPVLVVGETGTGKELIARAIHAAGPRRSGPFVGVNCAALPRELIESELFGYKRGAFSGAIADHVGLLRAATGGTLLLDEITEMSTELQAKLLRVMQELTVRPVGSVVEEPLDVRVVASTNRDPRSMLSCGALRADLYYRLSVSVIAVPPLRERRADIVPLVQHQLIALNERHRPAGGTRGITADAMCALREAAWMGNVRELFNVLENAFANCRSLLVGVADLALPPQPAPAPSAARTVELGAQTFAQGERALIEAALSSTGGNKRRAAQMLGISRKKLYAKLAKYGFPE
jgi:DNA-binding NtrC family response regulator